MPLTTSSAAPTWEDTSDASPSWVDTSEIPKFEDTVEHPNQELIATEQPEEVAPKAEPEIAIPDRNKLGTFQPSQYSSGSQNVAPLNAENPDYDFSRRAGKPLVDTIQGAADIVNKGVDLAGKSVLAVANLPTTISNALKGARPGMPNYVQPLDKASPKPEIPELTDDDLKTLGLPPLVKGIHDAIRENVSGLTEPQNALLLPILGIPSLTKNATRAFAVQLAANAPKAIGDILDAKDQQEAAKAWANGAIQALMLRGALKHGFESKPVAPTAETAAVNSLVRQAAPLQPESARAVESITGKDFIPRVKVNPPKIRDETPFVTSEEIIPETKGEPNAARINEQMREQNVPIAQELPAQAGEEIQPQSAGNGQPQGTPPNASPEVLLTKDTVAAVKQRIAQLNLPPDELAANVTRLRAESNAALQAEINKPLDQQNLSRARNLAAIGTQYAEVFKDVTGKHIDPPSEALVRAQQSSESTPQTESPNRTNPTSEAIETPASEVASISSQKYRVGKSPQLNTIVEKLPATEVEIANREQPVRIKNYKTGEVSTVMQSDLTAVSERIGEKVKKQTVADKLKSLGYTAREIAAMPKEGAKALADRGQTKLVSMGGLAPSDPLESVGKGGSGADIYGIAERVRQERADSGQVSEVPTGQGISSADSIERGRILLKEGAEPEKIMSAVESSGRFNADDVAITRAHGENLAKIARDTEEQFGTTSQQYLDAWKNLSEWDARIKPMQTEWHKMGAAQQGSTDIDTGDFTSLQRAYKADTGKDFTPSQANAAKKISERIKIASNDARIADAKLYDQLDLELGKVDAPEPKNLDEARQLFSGYKSGNNFSMQQVKTVWNSAKKFYLEQGVTNFHDVVNGLATDFGLKVDDVRKILAQPKGVKRFTDEAFRKQQAARRLDQNAKRWLKETTIPMFQRAIASVPSVLFGMKVGFHGTVALGTHAPMVAFQPRFWANYVRDFGKMYRMVGSRAYYETQVQDLLRRPNYITARRAGLVNDPYSGEDFNSPDVAKYIQGITQMGNRGYTVLKILRQDMFDQHWSNLPKSTQIPEVAKAIADGVNHATGVVKVNAPKGANVALFAPRLEMSRAAWLATDPTKAGLTFLNWKKATPSEKYFAVNQIKEKAWVLGTLTGLLALNQGVLTATGSKQKINILNPMQSDWMKFKIAGMDVSYGNAMVSMARLPIRLYSIRQSDGGKLKALVYPDEDTYSVLGEYARSQLSPFASLASTLWFKADWQNRPLPNSSRPVPKRLRAEGVKPYTWPEFFVEQALPIPAEEAAREVWKNGLGMSPEQIKSARSALATIAIMAATGARLTEDIHEKK